MNLNWTIGIGDIVVAATFVGTIFSVYLGIYGSLSEVKADIRVLKHDLGNIRTAVDLNANVLQSQGASLAKIAVQDQRLANLEEDIRDLRHGRGWIVEPPHVG